MRCLILCLLLTSPALAAPTCMDRHAVTTRCGTANAMPVGWTPPPAALVERRRLLPPPPSSDAMFKLVLGLAALLALIALLPEFDGHSDEDWQPRD
jgi:hypothetical protein